MGNPRAPEARACISASVQVLMGGLCCTAGYLILTIGSAEGHPCRCGPSPMCC
jgi:hypothetical protein